MRALVPSCSTRKVGNKAMIPTEKLAQQPKASVSAQMRRLGSTRRRISALGDGAKTMRLESRAISAPIRAQASMAARQDSRSAISPEPMAPSAKPTGTKLLHKASATARFWFGAVRKISSGAAITMLK